MPLPIVPAPIIPTRRIAILTSLDVREPKSLAERRTGKLPERGYVGSNQKYDLKALNPGARLRANLTTGKVVDFNHFASVVPIFLFHDYINSRLSTHRIFQWADRQ